MSWRRRCFLVQMVGRYSVICVCAKEIDDEYSLPEEIYALNHISRDLNIDAKGDTK